MNITKTLGGDRLGSGKKMQVQLHNYERSTHNLSRVFRSTMNVGTLVPFFTEIGLNGDTFDINLGSKIRTIPAISPLFGSFKFQLDVFQIPIRLYQGILHNNPINIGMKMDEVYFPTWQPNTTILHDYDWYKEKFKDINTCQISSSSLVAYTGVRGYGFISECYCPLEFNALPILAYYDIFKNYYANKQEENAYVIGSTTYDPDSDAKLYVKTAIGGLYRWQEVEYPTSFGSTDFEFAIVFSDKTHNEDDEFPIENIGLYVNSTDITFGDYPEYYKDVEDINYYNEWLPINTDVPRGWRDKRVIYFELKDITGTWTWINKQIENIVMQPTGVERGNTTLLPFKLENIDEMRQLLLSQNQIGDKLILKGSDNDLKLPYKQVVGATGAGTGYNAFVQNGLAVKTYQSDIFNNWIQTDWITGDNGIAAITAVDTSSDSFTIDALNLAQKVYNMLNRIAVSGGTYEDWQEAVYSEKALRRAETPIYCGGYSSEIVFEEVVSTAESGEKPLGTLAGRGAETGEQGGNIVIRCEEPCIIMGIASITPRLDYTQGNKWFVEELKTMDDLHKPALDGIGFQDLITRQMHWADGTLNEDENFATTFSAGKQPAWLNYMTSYNEAYGNFAIKNNQMQMILSRDYQLDKNGRIKDLTTYIDPRKYNYAFADNSLEAQNFWVQIGTKMIARRKISAKQIPNL